jgi:hypothetical protein
MKLQRQYKVKAATPEIVEADGGWQIVWKRNGRSESSRVRYKTYEAAEVMAASLMRKEDQ